VRAVLGGFAAPNTGAVGAGSLVGRVLGTAPASHLSVVNLRDSYQLASEMQELRKVMESVSQVASGGPDAAAIARAALASPGVPALQKEETTLQPAGDGWPLSLLGREGQHQGGSHEAVAGAAKRNAGPGLPAAVAPAAAAPAEAGAGAEQERPSAGVGSSGPWQGLLGGLLPSTALKGRGGR